MALRRELMSYLGTGAIGGIIGYYARAKGLLGLKSEEKVRTPSEDEESGDDEAPPEDEESGDGVFDDFEDQELDWEVIDGDSSLLTFASDAINGSQSLYFEQSGSNDNIKIAKNLSNSVTPSSISFWFKYNSRNDNQFNLKFMSSNENQIIEIREYFQTVHYKNTFEQGVTAVDVADVSMNSWYRVTLDNIDYDNSELDIVVSDSNETTINQASNISFREEAENFQRLRITNGLSNNGGSDPLWFDYITYSD